MDPLDDAREEVDEGSGVEDDHPMWALREAQTGAQADVVHQAQRNQVLVGLGLSGEPALPRFGGKYVVLGVLGQGGMGTVLEAYDQQLDRKVALKLLHLDLSERHARRLTREAQALARLEHPNVVQVYEVGEVQGRAFVAMQRVKGMTLRQWQKREPRPGWRQCVEVYVQAGRGLAAAHAAKLVHRDFKPDNCIIDEQGRVRVLDFGLARQVEDEEQSPSWTEATKVTSRPSDDALGSTLTRTGKGGVGTPAYMSPEQIRGAVTDARSDQFNFCVSLFEAVYGERPFARDSLAALAMSRDGEQVRPSPKGRKVPAKLRQVLVRGLATRAEERWPSMQVLLRELGQLVAPGKRRGLVVGVAGGLVAVGVGLVQYAEVGFRCEGAREKLKGVWDGERRQQVKRAVLGTGLSYAPDVWTRVVEPGLDDYADAWVAHHTEACEATSVREEQSEEVMDLRMGCLHRAKVELAAVTRVLATADATLVERAHEVVEGLRPLSRCEDVEALESEVEPPPPEEAAAVEEIRELLAQARAERDAGRYAAAQAKVERVEQRLIEIEYGPVHTEAAFEGGLVLELLGQHEASEAKLRRALQSAARWRQWDALQRAASSLMFVAGSRLKHVEQALGYRDLAEQLAVGDPVVEASTRSNVADVLRALGKYEEAEAENRRALMLAENALGPEHLDVARSHNNLAMVLEEQGKYEESAAEHLRALALREKALGPEHPDVATSRNNLAIVRSRQGKYEEAEPEYRRVLALREKALGPEHPDLAASYNNLALVLKGQGKYEEAETEIRRALTLLEGTVGPEHAGVAEARGNLADILRKQGRYEEAETENRRALARFEQILGPQHPAVAGSRNNLAVILELRGEYEEAEAEYRRVRALFDKAFGPAHPHVAMARNNLAGLLETRGKYEEAEAEYRRALALYEKAFDPDHPDIAMTRTGLALVLLKRGHADQGRLLAEQAWSRRQREDIATEEQAETAFVLARALWPRWEQRPRAWALAQRARDAYAKAGEPHRDALVEVEAWLSKHRTRSHSMKPR